MMKRFSILIVFLFGLLTAYAQDKSITGTIVDETGVGMPGATVQIKGTTKGTVTDVNGAYAITAPAGATLQISYVGYVVSEVVVGESNVINSNLVPDVKSLDEVVVVGYGVQKKSLVTGSISKVKTEELVSAPSLRVEQALQGRTSGVVFNQTSGNPGAGVTVRIRGVSSNNNADPLFIIDGMKTSKYVMNEIDPSDIESVEVLKDAASAAIYGSEGANGVIIITTKSGVGNKGKTTVSYDAYYGWQVAKPASSMSQDQYLDYFKEAYAYDKMYGNDPDGLGGLRLLAGTMNTAGVPGVYGSGSFKDSINTIYQDPATLYTSLRTKADQALADGTITPAAYKKFKFQNTAGAEVRIPKTFDQYKANLFNRTLTANTDNDYKIFKNYVNDTTGSNTNWLDQIFQTAPMQKHHLSVSTGNDISNLYISASYSTQDGVIGGAANNFTRYDFKASGDVQAKKWLKLGSSITVAQSKSRNLDALNDLYNGPIAAAMAHDPTIPVYWNDTTELWKYYKAVGQYPSDAKKRQALLDGLVKTDDGRYYSNSQMPVNERINPLAIIKLSENNRSLTERVIGNTYAEIKPFSFLTYRFSYGAELTNVTNDNWWIPYNVNGNRNRQYSEVHKDMNRYFNYQIDNVLTFQKTFGDHGITAMLGQSMNENTGYGVSANRINMWETTSDFAYIDAVPNNEFDTTSIYRRTNGGFQNITSMMGYFGRLNYDYKETWMFNATLRRDGSSKFEQNHRWGYFPSFSLGCNLNKYDFFSAIPNMSMLKVRGSWGQNGSVSSISDFQWIGYRTPAYSGGQKVTVKGVMTNPDLTWETSEQTNIGVDLGMFNNRLTLSAEYYQKTTKDLLAQPELAMWSASSVPDQNVGEVSNSGIELDLGFANRDNEFKYDAKLTATYLTNEVKSFEAARLNGYGAHGAPSQATAFEVGKPVWYFRGYKVDKIFQNWDEIKNYTYTDPKTGAVNLIQPTAVPGDAKISDVGGILDPATGKFSIPDGKIDANDFTDLGKPMPTFTFGLNLGCEFKGLDFSMFWYSELDKVIYNNTLRTDFLHLNRAETFYTERWTPTNGSNDFIRARYQDGTTGSTQIGFNSLFFEDASFLRLKNIQLGYTLPKTFTQKIDISKLRVYVSASNLVTFTGYTGSDPEIGVTDGNNSYGVDKGMYPSSKQYIIGLNVTF